MKFYAIILILFFGVACNTNSSSSTTTTNSSMNLDGYEQEDFGNGIVKVIKYNEDRIPLESGFLLNGIKNGMWATHWKDNGRIKVLTSYINGVKNGVSLEFNNRGQVEKKINYANGKKNGFAGNYKFGRTELLAKYKDDQFDGDYKEYFTSGTNAGDISKLVQYKNGKQDGKLIYYNEEGNVVMEYLYKDGKKISGGMVKK